MKSDRLSAKTEHLRVALLQCDLIWERPVSNIQLISDQLHKLKSAVDVIILPEMWATGFTMQPERCGVNWTTSRDRMNPSSAENPLQAMEAWSRQHQALVIGSLACTLDTNTHVNRCIAMFPDGTHAWYDKRHLFGFAGEDGVYTPGEESVRIHWKGWTILLQICYDLRFPVFSRNTANEPYDVAVYVANWPAARREAWNALLPARAIENQAFCLGVNRVGTDGNGIEYAGDSAIYHPKGHAIEKAEPFGQNWCIGTCSASELDAYRSKFPVLRDADDFEIKRMRSNR